MVNKEVCSYLESLDDHKNQDGLEYIADICVRAGVGQTKGGYLDGRFPINRDKAEPSQKQHFIGYYGDAERCERNPSYSSLYCPQLMLFIAEISGVSRERLEEAYNILYNYEKEHNLIETKKGATYIHGKDVFDDFKEKIMINEVNKIIKESDCWDTVMSKCKKLTT